MNGIYIHVPFCKRKCIYCDFYSTTAGGEWKSLYVDALLRELRFRAERETLTRVRTIYIGGGTPSQLHPGQLERIFQAIWSLFSVEPDAEVTLEANPEDVTPEWVQALGGMPVNRISMGVQSLDDSVLNTLGRRHTARQALDAVDRCLSVGIQNMSMDLIYGLPGQTMAMWQSDVNTLLRLGIPHLSCYSLQIEDGTRLKKMITDGLCFEADEELSLSMYEWLMDAASEAGWDHYEISNFCQPGKRSRHNTSYWLQVPYLGFGPGAHSYDGHRVRRWNATRLRDYVESNGDVPHETENLTDDELYDEFVMTRLRTREGLPLRLLSESSRAYCLQMAQPHLKSGKMRLDGDKLRLTRAGIFVSDDLMSDLMR